MLEEPEQPSQVPIRRILTLDGGGILGTFPAAFLAQLERELDHPVGAYFDLIAGTSTGGILALGLATGRPASTLVELYERRGPDIFGGNGGPVSNFIKRRLRGIRHLYRRKHDSDKLRAALADEFGDERIGHAKTRLVIPAWDPLARSVYIYKTAHHPRLKTDYKTSLVDAALATSAAPTYFKQHITEHDVGLIDGGVWGNNPVAIAAVEAITLLGWPAESLRILSLGCLEETYTIPKWAGIGSLGAKIVKLFMDGQSHGALGMAKLITGHEHERDALYRINHTVPYNSFKMDDARVIQDLKGLGHSMARDRQPVLEPVFFGETAEPFTPIHQLSKESQWQST